MADLPLKSLDYQPYLLENKIAYFDI